MKMNALSYMIKYLPFLVVTFQAAIHKYLLWQNVAHFERVEPATIYMSKKFHLHSGFYSSTFVYSCFSTKIQFFDCLLSSVAP